jgi:hypothetical protein
LHPETPVEEKPRAMRRGNITAVVAWLTQLLGEPLATPELVWDGEKLVAASYRTFSWVCPCCMGGYLDGDEGDTLLHRLFPRRPFSVDTEGNVWCRDCWASEIVIVQTLKLIEAVA